MTGQSKQGKPVSDDTDRAPVQDDPISRNLQQIYDEVANEELPKHFLDLLARLDEAEKSEGRHE